MKYLFSIFPYFHHRANNIPTNPFHTNQFYFQTACTSNNKFDIFRTSCTMLSRMPFSCSDSPTSLRFLLAMPFSANLNGTFLPELSLLRFILTQQPRSPLFSLGYKQSATSSATLSQRSRPSAKHPAPYAITTTLSSY